METDNKESGMDLLTLGIQQRWMLTILADRVHFKEGTGLKMALVRVFGTLPRINEMKKKKNQNCLYFFLPNCSFSCFYWFIKSCKSVKVFESQHWTLLKILLIMDKNDS